MLDQLEVCTSGELEVNEEDYWVSDIFNLLLLSCQLGTSLVKTLSEEEDLIAFQLFILSEDCFTNINITSNDHARSSLEVSKSFIP